MDFASVRLICDTAEKVTAFVVVACFVFRLVFQRE